MKLPDHWQKCADHIGGDYVENYEKLLKEKVKLNSMV
jgi:hypothetical protein